MDQGGPPQGAPGDPLGMAGVDRTVDVSEQHWPSEHTSSLPILPMLDQRKLNNRLLFLTVEYVEDQSRDYSRIFPAYEQVSFSPQAASPLSDFAHRVSPLDPNMSSTARYSPTPVQMPPSPFHNSVVVLQGPSCPLISAPEQISNVQPNINYVTQLADPTTSQTVVPTDTSADFVVAGNEGLDAAVNGGLILMQGAPPELETAAAPLMLAGIPGTDFALTRDFLVTHDEQMMSAYKNQSMDIGGGQPVHQMLNGQNDLQLVLPPENQIQTVNQILPNNTKEESSQTNERTGVRRSRRQLNDKKSSLCLECDTEGVYANSCTRHNVQTISDQPVPSRARATLPGSYLTINKIPMAGVAPGGSNFGVFAKRNIRKHTQFGPIEGMLCTYGGPIAQNELPLLYETENGALLKIDVSNENSSNWMRFVRPALTFGEQNLLISQQTEGLVFRTTRNILLREELKAGPSIEYAQRRNMTPLIPDPHEVKEMNNQLNTWPCFECNQRFPTSEKLQKHLNVHDNPKSDMRSRSKRKKMHMASNKLLKIVDRQSLIYKCPHCPKVFPRSHSLKRHLVSHPSAKASRYECSSCGESFLHAYKRSRHMKIFHSGKSKEKENTKQNSSKWKCKTCSMVFTKASLLNLHTLIHTTDNLEADDPSASRPTSCPQCGAQFEKKKDLISHVAQHGRLQTKKSPKSIPAIDYKCSMCYKRFTTKVRLQQHCLVHCADVQKPLSCNVCSKRFMNNSALSCHLKTHSEDRLVHECPMCRQRFDQVLMLRDHIEIHRNEDEGFNCPHCAKSFIKYSVIRKHIRAHHSELKHECQFCAKRFPTSDKLKMHLLRHSDHREFHCGNCGKQFKRKDKLKEHMTRMHNAERTNQEQVPQGQQVKKFVPKVNPTDYNRFVYKCHQCLVGFKRRGMLVNHLAKRHPDVPPESVPELNLPILRQTRDYYCQYCEKVYKSSSKRKAHIMKNHPGSALPPSNRRKEPDVPGVPNPTFSQTVGSVTTTPQGCQWCHKQYASKAKLLQHQRKKHPTLMEPADQIPRPRSRHAQNQDLLPTLNDNNFLMSDYIQGCDIDTDFLKPKIIKVADGIGPMGNGLDGVGQQFMRMQDIR